MRRHDAYHQDAETMTGPLGLKPLELKIEKLVYGGEGLSRREGQVILTPFVLPGEDVLAEAAPSRSGAARARATRIATSSQDRISPECPVFGKCGGCHYQHARYEAQLSAKREILIETLQRVGRVAAPENVEVIAGEPWGYRNRVQLHIEGHVNGARLGFREARSHELVDIESCPVGSPMINAAIAVLREMVRDPRWPKFLHAIELFTNETELQLAVLDSEKPVARRFFDWCQERLPHMARHAIDYRAAGFRFRVSPGSFFQVNRFLVERLVESALSGAKPASSAVQGETALDLYAGVGLFTLPLGRQFSSVTAVEAGKRAASDLEHNVETFGNTEGSPNSEPHGPAFKVHAEAVEKCLEGLETEPEFVLADPPRAGLGHRVVHELLRLQPRRIHIVSCDPATLSRDLADLLASGYRLLGLTMIDLFPQTFHIETIARLEKL